MTPAPATPAAVPADAAVRDTLRAAAVAYAKLGWRVVPVQFQGKRPVDGDGWQTERYRRTPDEAGARWERALNVGVLLGPESGELVDIDLDCPETRELADEYLPTGAWVFGRASSCRSHRLYRSPGAALLQLYDLPPADGAKGKAQTLVELRAKPANGIGEQTVFPPSVHTSGERIEWDADEGDGLELPRLVEPAELVARVRRLAVAAFLARHLPGGVPAARAHLAAPNDTLSPAVAAHTLALAGLPPAHAAPSTAPPAPRWREVKGTPAGGDDLFAAFRSRGIQHAAAVLGVAWDERRKALVRCPACGEETRSSSDKRPAAGVVGATKPGGDGTELWTHGKCKATGDAVVLAAAVLLGTTRPASPACEEWPRPPRCGRCWRCLAAKLRERWSP